MSVGAMAFRGLGALLILSLLMPAASVRVATPDMSVLLALRAGWIGADLGSWNSSANCSGFWGITCNAKGRVTEIVLTTNFSLTGVIPPSIGNLTLLETLYLKDNNLTGPIPTAIANLRSLQLINLEGNRLTGRIPDIWANFSQLSFLTLSSNRLVGPIPPSILNLTNVEKLVLSGNKLTGRIPLTIGVLENLRILILSSNGLSGRIPGSIGSLSLLQILYLDNNKLTGSVPGSFQNLTAINLLNLSRNQLAGAAPTSFQSSLFKYNVGFNYFTSFAAPVKDFEVACPFSDGNCIPKADNATCRAKGPQRGGVACDSFCKVTTPGFLPPCSGHGFCYLPAHSKQAGCICDASYKKGASPYSCVPVRGRGQP